MNEWILEQLMPSFKLGLSGLGGIFIILLSIDCIKESRKKHLKIWKLDTFLASVLLTFALIAMWLFWGN